MAKSLLQHCSEADRREGLSPRDFCTILNDMKSLDPATLANADMSLLEYGADISAAALNDPEVLRDFAANPAEAADTIAGLTAQWRVALFASDPSFCTTDEFAGWAYSLASAGLCDDFVKLVKDPEAARGVFKQLYLRGYERLHNLRQEKAASTRDADASASARATRLKLVAVTHKQAVWEHVSRTLYLEFKRFTHKWFVAHKSLPQREQNGPWYVALQEQFESWDSGGSAPAVSESLAEIAACREEVDSLLFHIIAKANELGAEKMCDLSHCEGPWLAGPLHAEFSPEYMLEYYASDKSAALRELGFLSFDKSEDMRPHPTGLVYEP